MDLSPEDLMDREPIFFSLPQAPIGKQEMEPSTPGL